MADETTAPAPASPNGARSMCATAEGLLERAIRCFTELGADCEVPQHEPCFLRQPQNLIAVLVGFEVAAMVGHSGGGEWLNELVARWRAEPEQSAAALRELMTRPVPTSPDIDDRPWPGHYL